MCFVDVWMVFLVCFGFYRRKIDLLASKQYYCSFINANRKETKWRKVKIKIEREREKRKKMDPF